MYVIYTTRTNWEQLCELSRALFVEESDTARVKPDLLYEPAFMTQRCHTPWHAAISGDLVIRGYREEDNRPYCWKLGGVVIAVRKAWTRWYVQIGYEVPMSSESPVPDTAWALEALKAFLEREKTHVEMIPRVRV